MADYNPHDRQDFHEGLDLDTNIELDGATASYPDDSILHGVLSDMDDRIIAAAASGGNQEFITGSNADFSADLGDWTNSGGTLSRDTSTKIDGLVASLQFDTTSSGNYVELPLAGTFEVGKTYQAMILARADDTLGLDASLTLGLIGTDSAVLSFASVPVGGPWAGLLVRWSPSADRTGVSLRFGIDASFPDASLTMRIGFARCISTNNIVDVGTLLTDHPGGTNADSEITRVLSGGGTRTIRAAIDGAAAIFQPIRVGLQSPDESAILLVGDEYVELQVLHTNGDFTYSGFAMTVGGSFNYIYFSGKDSGTIQAYGYGGNVELADNPDGGPYRWLHRDVNDRIKYLADMSSKYAEDIGDGISTSFQVTHNLGTTDILVEVYEISSGASVSPLTTTRDDADNVTVTFAAPVGTDAYRVVVIG